MTAPRRLSKWGRNYVASWIAKDRAANIAIDPCAEAYAAGLRSPYEPLRMVPSTWKIFGAEIAPGTPTVAVQLSWKDWFLNPLWVTVGHVADRMLHSLRWTVPERGRLANELLAVLRMAALCTLH
jgi:hypothetical protein